MNPAERALDPHTSECSLARADFEPFLTGKLILEMGAGGDTTVPHALPFDMPQPYTRVGGVPQILRGDCRNLGMFCDGVVDGIASHHLLEDWTYNDLVPLLAEWRRVLKTGGVICTNCPNQQTFLAHCAATGQGTNDAHKEPDFSIENFEQRVLSRTGPWVTLLRKPVVPPYSWYLVIQKV